tara:strand:- start:996 stop:2198 length:1203 start_codon:yes stop_codon:yes gene_type:complete
MLELEKLYNYLEYKYNEDLDYIDDIYLYLHINKLISENESEKDIVKQMELLDKGVYVKLKYEDIQINTLHDMLIKLNEDKNMLEESINNKLDKYNKNLEDLTDIHNNISNINEKEAQTENTDCSLELFNKKLEIWWKWISNDIIKKIVKYSNNNSKEEKYKINICKQIFKYFNLVNKIANIEEYSYKLIIYDVKNYGKKNLDTYPLDLLLNCCCYINTKLNKYYPEIFTNTEDIKSVLTDFNYVTNYLLIHENLYDIDDENDIIIFKVKDNIDLFNKLNSCYNIYKTIKIALKIQFDSTQNIVLTSNLTELFSVLYKLIHEFDKKINDKTIRNEIYKKLNINDSVKNKYYVYVKYLNNIIYQIFHYYFENVLKKNTSIHKCLEKKYTYLIDNNVKYTDKI